MQISHFIIASILAYTSTAHPAGLDERQTETAPSPVLVVPEVHKRYTITVPTIPAIPAVPDVPAVPSPTPRAKKQNNVLESVTEEVSDPKVHRRQYTITVPTIPAIPAVPEVPAVPSPTPRVNAKKHDTIAFDTPVESETPTESEDLEPEEPEEIAESNIQRRQQTITVPAIPAIPAVPAVPAVPSPHPNQS